MAPTPLDELAKQLLVMRMEPAPDAASAAAELARALLSAAVSRAPFRGAAARKATREVCRGLMLGFLVRRVDPARGAVALLNAVAEACPAMSLHPTDAMTSALEGVADVRSLLVPDDVLAIQDAVAGEFLGAGEAFANLIRGKGGAPFRFASSNS